MKEECDDDDVRFSFKVKTRAGYYEEYSGKFNTIEQAREWYEDTLRGAMLRQTFGRKLYLFFCGVLINRPWINNN